MAHQNPVNSSNHSLRPTDHLSQGSDAAQPQTQIFQGGTDLDNLHLGAINLGAMVDGIEAGIVICDRHRAITVMNRVARALLLPQASAPVTLDAVTFYRPGSRAPLPTDDLPLWQALAGEDRHDLELAIVHPQGDRYIVLGSGRQLTGSKGEVQGAIMTLYDITQRYTAEAMLRSSNLGLKTEVHRRLEDLETVNEKLHHYAQRLQGIHTMDRAILAQFQPPGVTRSALRLLCQLLDCQQGIVTLFDRKTQQGEIIADTADDTLCPAGTRLPLADFVFAQSTGRCRMRRVKAIAQMKHPPLIFQCLLAANLQSAMTVPLLVNGKVIGEVTLADHRLNHFHADHEEVIQEVTDHLAIALQSARLFEQVTVDRQRLKDLSSQLLETQEAERRTLAHELHDEIGQALTAVKLNLCRLERLVETALAKSVLDDCAAITDSALQQVRNLSLDLRPSMLDDLGLVPALRWYISRHAERTGLVERFTCDTDLCQLSTQIKTTCFRIVQESLTNVARHAQAQTVTITLVASALGLSLTIQDDGIGFNIDTLRYAKSHGTSLGLLGMEERSLLIGGQLSFTSAPGQGTGVNLWVPLSSA